jgi:hypothetical protein
MDSSESLRHIAEHLRRLARAAYGSPCRVQVTDETLREYAAELERIADATESKTRHLDDDPKLAHMQHRPR